MGSGAAPDGSLTRRSALLSVAALVLAGCRRLPARAAHPTSEARPTIIVHDQWYYDIVPGLARAFNSVHRDVAVQTGTVQVSGVPTPYVLQLANPAVVGNHHTAYLPLDGLLRSGNFDPSTFGPGLLDGFRWRGQLYGLPVQQYPFAIRWRKDVFAAAGLPPPDPTWTMDDFIKTCAAIAAFIPTGKVQGLKAVLPPMRTYKVGGRPYGGFSAFLWTAFALGYGGSVVRDGTFAFDSAAIEGVSTLVDVGRRFGAPASALPDKVSDTTLYALAFNVWKSPKLDQTTGSSGLVQAGSAPSFDARWGFARMPRFPVRPVIPTSVTGAAIGGPATGEAVGLQAAGVALTWLYSQEAQAALADWGAVPVLADPGTQRAFWGRLPPEDQAVGDWSNFLPYDTGWPADPPDSVSGVLQAALDDPSQLEVQLATALRQMNIAAEASPRA